MTEFMTAAWIDEFIGLAHTDSIERTRDRQKRAEHERHEVSNFLASEIQHVIGRVCYIEPGANSIEVDGIQFAVLHDDDSRDFVIRAACRNCGATWRSRDLKYVHNRVDVGYELLARQQFLIGHYCDTRPRDEDGEVIGVQPAPAQQPTLDERFLTVLRELIDARIAYDHRRDES